MPDLSVIIVSYNTRELLRDCLRSLQAATDLQLEIIVVENASADGTPDMLRRDFPNITTLQQSTNTWYCTGNNIGIQQASADYVLLLNPDTTVEPNALSLMLAFIKAHPQYAAVTAQLSYPNGEVQRTGSEIPSYLSLLLDYSALGLLLPNLKKRAHDQIYYSDWDRQSDRDIAVVPGSCTLMPRHKLSLDDDLLLYFPEDTLAQNHKRRAWFLSNAKITHHEKSSTNSWLATRVFFRDLMTYTRKQHGTPRMLLLYLLSRPLYALMRLKNR